MLSDLRDTGQLEQDCDIWIGLYRDSVYHADSPNPPELVEAIVRYNQHGGTGTAFINGHVGDFLSNVVFDNPSTRKSMSAKYATGNALIEIGAEGDRELHV